MRAPSDSERRVAQIALLDAAWLLTTRTRRGSADRRSTQIALLDGGFAVARLTAARDDLEARLQASSEALSESEHVLARATDRLTGSGRRHRSSV
jgi:hypothetical protein